MAYKPYQTIPEKILRGLLYFTIGLAIVFISSSILLVLSAFWRGVL